MTARIIAGAPQPPLVYPDGFRPDYEGGFTCVHCRAGASATPAAEHMMEKWKREHRVTCPPREESVS